MWYVLVIVVEDLLGEFGLSSVSSILNASFGVGFSSSIKLGVMQFRGAGSLCLIIKYPGSKVLLLRVSTEILSKILTLQPRFNNSSCNGQAFCPLFT